MRRIRSSAVVAVLVALSVALGAPAPILAQEAHPLIVEADSMMAGIEAMRAEFRDLESRVKGMSGEDSVVTVRRMTNIVVDALDEVNQLANLVVQQEEEGLDSSRFRTYLTEVLERVPPALDALDEDLRTSLASAEERAKNADPGDLGLIEAEIARLNERLDGIYGQSVEYVESLDRLGLDDSAARTRLSGELEQRAQLIAGRMRRAIRERDRYEAQAEQYPGEASYRLRADAARAAIDGEVASLERTADTMDRLGLEVTEYRTLLVEATGELARGLGDAKVAMSLLKRWMGKARNWFLDSGPGLLVKILVFLVILAVFRGLSRLTRKAVVRSIDKSRLQPSQLMRNMISNMTGNLVMAFGLLVALSQIGVSMGPLLAGLGVAGFIVGFALQETLANFAAGLMILFYRPYDVGDMVEAATVFGKVHHMSLVSTTILTIDNQTLIVPNGKIWGDVIKNVTAQKVRRVDMMFGISYSDDIPKSEAILESILKKHDMVLDDPEPMVKLHELGDSSVNFVVRPWVKTDDYWDVYWDVTREVKMRFDAEGVSIPFPQRDVHMYEEKLLRPGQGE